MTFMMANALRGGREFAWQVQLHHEAEVAMVAHIGYWQLGEEGTAEMFWQKFLRYFRLGSRREEDFVQIAESATVAVWEYLDCQPLKLPRRFRAIPVKARAAIDGYFEAA